MAGPRLAAAAAAAGRNGKRNVTQIQHQLAEFFNAGSQWHLSILLQVLWQKSETLYKTDGKEFGGWKIPKASNNNRCAPGGRNWEIDGWRKKSTVFILELWCRTAPDTTCVQGNGTASRELSPIPTVPTSDRNKSSFDPWKRFRAAATNAAA